MQITSTYKKFKDDINQIYYEYGSNDYISFGVLLASYNQTEAREYIYEFLNDYDESAGKYYDFFIPGFDLCKSEQDADVELLRTKKSYKFNRKIYKEFCDSFRDEYGIEKTYNPLLVLVTMQPGKFGEMQYIVIELDTFDACGVKRSGELFERIFNAAKKEQSIQGQKKNIVKNLIKTNWLESLANVFSGDLLQEINKIGTEYKRYRIKGV